MSFPDSVEITLRRGGQYEEWVVVYPDGRIKIHGENDGHAFFRKGAEDRDEFVALDEFRRRYAGVTVSGAWNGKGYDLDRPVEQVEKALAVFANAK